MEKVSVIVPIYKVEAYLDKCIQSILAQTYEKLEIILVNDGSPDNCPAICDAWGSKDSRIKVVHKENGGLSDARNAGLAEATGEYTVFVDSDDLISCRYVESLLNAARENGTPIAACDVQVFIDGEEPMEPEAGLMSCKTAQQALEELTSGEGIRAVAWNKIYHTELLKGELFPVGRHHEDEFFTYRLLHKAGSIAWVDVPLYFYRQRSGSIMHEFSIKRLDALDAYLQRIELFRTHYPEIFRKDKVSFCVSCCMFYAGGIKNDYKELGALRKAILLRRKQIRFTAGELKRYSFRELFFILASRYALATAGHYLAGRQHG